MAHDEPPHQDLRCLLIQLLLSLIHKELIIADLKIQFRTNAKLKVSNQTAKLHIRLSPAALSLMVLIPNVWASVVSISLFLNIVGSHTMIGAWEWPEESWWWFLGSLAFSTVICYSVSAEKNFRIMTTARFWLYHILCPNLGSVLNKMGYKIIYLQSVSFD